MNKKVIAGVVGALVVLLAGFFIVVNYTYSEGIRQGVVTKISHKGHLCKTWEGELAMVNFFTGDSRRGTESSGNDNTFYFSAANNKIAEQLKTLMTENLVVNLSYQQKLFSMDWPVPGFCQRRTDYEVYEVSVVKNATPGSAGLAPVKP